MKKSFLGYYQPTKEEFKELWNKCIFILDTNVLLNLYKYTPLTRAEFSKILYRISSRLWIPHQVALEYQCNRLNVIEQQKEAYNGVLRILENAQKSITEKLDEYRRHTYIDIQSIIKKSDRLIKKISNEIITKQSQHPDLFVTDELREGITELFDDKVGLPYSSERMKEIYTDGERRFQENIPPGYLDAKDKKDNKKYSDLIIWFQIMDKARIENLPVILVIDDLKDDWWWRSSGKTIGPRPELISEFVSNTGQRIYMYPSDRFMEYARDYLQEQVGQKAINEVQSIRKEDYEKNIRVTLDRQRQESDLSAIDQLRMNWVQIIKYAPDHLGLTPGAALLRSMIPIAIEGDSIILSCKYAYHKEKLEDPRNMEVAEKILSTFLGRPCHIRLVLDLPSHVGDYSHQDNNILST